MNTNKSNKTHQLVITALFGAISAVLMLVEVSVPFAPTFIKFDLSELPIILGGYMMGPIAGITIAILKILLHLLLKGTSTMFVGEISNFLGSICYMVPAVFLYHRKRTKNGATISLVIATIIVSICLLLSNTFFVFPAYAKLFGMDMDTIVAMGSATNPLVTNYFTLMLCSILPFNLFKYGVTSFLTLHLYKRLKKVLHF